MPNTTIASIFVNLTRLALRYIRRFVELPTLMVFGTLILLIWFLLAASANVAAQSIALFFTHYFVEIPLGTRIDMYNVSLNISQMMKLFTIWGVTYFVVAEACSWLIHRLTQRKLPNSRLILLAIIFIGYAGLIGIYQLHRQTSAPIQGIISVAIFLVSIAAGSLGLSSLIMRLEQKITPRNIPAINK